MKNPGNIGWWIGPWQRLLSRSQRLSVKIVNLTLISVFVYYSFFRRSYCITEQCGSKWGLSPSPDIELKRNMKRIMPELPFALLRDLKDLCMPTSRYILLLQTVVVTGYVYAPARSGSQFLSRKTVLHERQFYVSMWSKVSSTRGLSEAFNHCCHSCSGLQISYKYRTESRIKKHLSLQWIMTPVLQTLVAFAVRISLRRLLLGQMSLAVSDYSSHML